MNSCCKIIMFIEKEGVFPIFIISFIKKKEGEHENNN